jgi:hypothetical protein
VDIPGKERKKPVCVGYSFGKVCIVVIIIIQGQVLLDLISENKKVATANIGATTRPWVLTALVPKNNLFTSHPALLSASRHGSWPPPGFSFVGDIRWIF